LHVWILPFSMLRRWAPFLPEDKKQQRDLKIYHNEGVSEVQFTRKPDDLLDLDKLHKVFDMRDFLVFKQARKADSDAKDARKDNKGATFKEPSPNSLDQLIHDQNGNEDAVDFPGSNRVYFGPPGTGKSHQLREELQDARLSGRVRTVTFHPEYTYSDFVGSYRPTMVYHGDDQYRDGFGRVIPIGGRPAVVYALAPGPLIQMICKALCNPADHFYLVVEELNRGNCAAIFGDLFQLLDRLDDGESEHAVLVESDLMTYVHQQIADQPEGVKRRFDSEGMYLPSNLSIYATMNTSDQSLYPMDAAMKRRWEMKYVPIDYAEARGRMVSINGYGEMDWGDVLFRINKAIIEYTHTDDKQIGQWFVKSKTIGADTFRDKVLSYLWFDIYRSSPQDLFDLDKQAYSYENLVAKYNRDEKVFKEGILEGVKAETQGIADVQ